MKKKKDKEDLVKIAVFLPPKLKKKFARFCVENETTYTAYLRKKIKESLQISSKGEI